MFDKWLWLGSISVFNGKISTLLHKNFDFSKNAVRNFNFILGYTIFTFISIILKSFKKKSQLNFPFYSIIFLTLIIFKPALESTNSDLQSQIRKCFTKDFFSVEVLDLCNRLHDSYHHYQDCFIATSVLKYKNYRTFYQMLLILSGDIILFLHQKAFPSLFGNLLKIRVFIFCI